MLFSLGNQETLYYSKNNLCLLRDNSKAAICKIAKLTKLMTAKIHLVIRSYSGVRHSSSPSERWCPARVGMVHRRHPHHTHFGTSLSPSCKQMPLSQLMHGWMDSWKDGWISFTPFTFLLHSQCTSVFLLPAVLRCQKSLSPCLESEGGISVSIQSCVGGRRQTMNIRICGIELRVIFSAILLPHLPAPRAAELETNLREVWY